MSYSLEKIIGEVKIPSQSFLWIGPYFVKKDLPVNNYFVRRVGSDKTQVLHQMRLRAFRLRQPIPDLKVTSQKWKLAPR